MALNRPLLAVVGGALAAVLASVGGVAYVKLRTGPLAERLVREANALVRTGYPRPAHVTPAEPGSFAEHLDPLMAEVLRVYEQELREGSGEDDAFTPCLPQSAGRQIPKELVAGCHESLERGREVMRKVLLATRTEAGGLPEWLSALADITHESAHVPPARLGLGHAQHALRHLVRLAALETRLLVARGQSEEAVDTCLDALALSRELAAGTALNGQRVAAEAYEAVFRPCADALDQAPAERKRAALTQLARLGGSFPPLSQALKEQSVFLQLERFRDGLMPEEQVLALPAIARPSTSASSIPVFTLRSERRHPLVSPLDDRLMWQQLVRLYDELAAAADLPPGARRRAFTALAARANGHWRGGDFGPYLGLQAERAQAAAEQVDVRRMQHDALITLTEVDLERAEKGRWPESLSHRVTSSLVLESVGAGVALLRPCARALAQYELRLTMDAPPSPRLQAP